MIPLIVAGLALGSTLWGGKKSLDGLSSRRKAKQCETEASASITEARDRLRSAKTKTQERLELLAIARGDAARVIAGQAIPQLRRVSDVDDQGRIFAKEPCTTHALPDAKLAETGGAVISVGMGGLLGRMAGTGLSSAALGAATSFGVASTGTAISGLSGVAAKNASLAYLGGGSLAAGGFGMAGGTAVLSGVGVGVPILVMGLRFASKCEERLVAAERYHADAIVAAEQAKADIVRLHAIAWRADEVVDVTKELARRVGNAACALERVLDTAGVTVGADFASLPVRARTAAQVLLKLTIALDDVVAVDLFDEMGDVLSAPDDAVSVARSACSWKV